jgi:hypothetical protein
MDAPHEDLTADRPTTGRLRPRRALCAPSPRQSGRRGHSLCRVGDDVGRPHVALRATPG